MRLVRCPEDLHAEVRRILGATVVMPQRTSKIDDILDGIFLNPVLGIALLLGVMFVVFQAVFTWATPMMDGITALFDYLSALAGANMPDGLLKGFVQNCLIGGLGSVIVFLPQILILFFFILVLEESGYLPRAAFLLDKPMSKAGLTGRSFIPLLSSHACAIPGIMATRSIHDMRDRVATILIAPLMTCSARLPVYGLMIAAFIPEHKIAGVLSFQGLILFALYLVGIGSGLLVSLVMTIARKDKTEHPLMMELPSYRLPNARNLAIGLIERAKIFMRRITGTIFAANTILWVLTTFPGKPAGATGPAIDYSLAGMVGHAMQPLVRAARFQLADLCRAYPGPDGAGSGRVVAGDCLFSDRQQRGCGIGGARPPDLVAVEPGNGAVADGLVRLRAAVHVDPGCYSPRNQFVEDGGGHRRLPVRPGLCRGFRHLSDRGECVMIYAVFQAVLITVIVAFSAVQVTRKLFPKTAAAVQTRFSASLKGKGGMLARAGAKLDAPAASGGCGSDDGCGTCNSCGTIASLTKDLGPPVRR